MRVEVGGPVSTARGGLVPVLELLARKGFLVDLPDSGVGPSQGWSDGQMMLAVVFLNIAGLDRVSDIEVLEADRGLCALVRRFEPRLFGVSRGSIARRFRGGRERCFPSARSIRDWLDRFHVAGVHDGERKKGNAFIPPPGARHDLLCEVNRRLVAEGVRAGGVASVTIDLDATIIASGKRECLSTYRAADGSVPGERGYQPLIAFCPETGMVPWLELRDGNVPAKLDNRRGFEEALMQLPGTVGRAVLRSDAAGYQEEVIRACNEPALRKEETHRFGTVGLVCGAVRSEALMQLPGTVGRAVLRSDAAGYQEEVIRACNEPALRKEETHRFGTVGLVCGAVRSEALMAEVARLADDAWRPVPADRRRRRAASGRGQLECAELPYVPASTLGMKPHHVVRYVVTRRVPPANWALTRETCRRPRAGPPTESGPM